MSCYYMIGLEGNKDPDQPDLKNLRYLSLLEDRNFGETGKIPLFYNPNTGRLLEATKDQQQEQEQTYDQTDEQTKPEINPQASRLGSPEPEEESTSEAETGKELDNAGF